MIRLFTRSIADSAVIRRDANRPGLFATPRPADALDRPIFRELPAQPSETPAARLQFIDGMRGLAALYVVFHHAYLEATRPPEFASIVQALGPARILFESGKLAVDVFIVLSGYVLMLPIIRAQGRMRSPGSYLLRRCRRILPPYYVALAVSLLTIVLIPEMNQRHGSLWDKTLPAFDAGTILSHLFLFFNLSPQWAYKINHAMWSIATEFQIYLLFPLLLLPLWRRFGLAAMTIVAFALTAPLGYLLPSVLPARPWYLGLFAMGMCAAVVGFSQDPQNQRRGASAGWSWLALAAVFAGAALAMAGTRMKSHAWLADVVVGLATMAVIVVCASSQTQSIIHRRLLPVFQSRVAVLLGAFSYSLYLIHPPIIAYCQVRLLRLHLSPGAHLACMLLIGAATSVLAGMAMYWLIERWFLPCSARPAKTPARI